MRVSTIRISALDLHSAANAPLTLRLERYCADLERSNSGKKQKWLRCMPGDPTALWLAKKLETLPHSVYRQIHLIPIHCPTDSSSRRSAIGLNQIQRRFHATVERRTPHQGSMAL